MGINPQRSVSMLQGCSQRYPVTGLVQGPIALDHTFLTHVSEGTSHWAHHGTHAHLNRQVDVNSLQLGNRSALPIGFGSQSPMGKLHGPGFMLKEPFPMILENLERIVWVAERESSRDPPNLIGGEQGEALRRLRLSARGSKGKREARRAASACCPGVCLSQVFSGALLSVAFFAAMEGTCPFSCPLATAGLVALYQACSGQLEAMTWCNNCIRSSCPWGQLST